MIATRHVRRVMRRRTLRRWRQIWVQVLADLGRVGI
jgi:hypothetical protein